MLKTAQRSAVVAYLRAAIDPVVVQALANRDDTMLASWLNSPSDVDAWMTQAGRAQLFEAMGIAKYDSLSAGKRDAWRLMMDFSPIDMTRAKMRNAVVDIWGTDAASVLAGLTEKATHAQAAIGGPSRTTSTVTAINRAFADYVTVDDVSYALNVTP
jgi:hypothetical protein